MKINYQLIIILLIIPLVMISGCTGAFTLNNQTVTTPIPNATISSTGTPVPGMNNQSAPLVTQTPINNVSQTSSNYTQNNTGSSATPTPAPTAKPSASSTASPTPYPSATANPTPSPTPSSTPVPHTTGSVTGRVTTYNSIGIGGAYVAIVDANDPSHVYYETTADSGGYYAFTNVNTTNGQSLYKMYARQSSYGEGYSSSFAVYVGTSCTSVVILTVTPGPSATPSAGPSGFITGRVTTSNMAGIGGAYVAIVDASDNNIKYYQGTSDSNGYYSFTGVDPTRSYQVYAKLDPFGEGYSHSFSVEAGSTSTTSVVIFLKPNSISTSSSGNVPADGSSYVTITAHVTDCLGGNIADGCPIVFSLTNTSGSAGSLASASSGTPAGNSVTAYTTNGYASVQFGWATIAGMNTIKAEYRDNSAVSSSVNVQITS